MLEHFHVFEIRPFRFIINKLGPLPQQLSSRRSNQCKCNEIKRKNATISQKNDARENPCQTVRKVRESNALRKDYAFLFDSA